MHLSEERIKAFEAFVAATMEEHKAPGLSIAIAQGDDVVYTKAFGVRQLEKKLPVTTETIFGIASITKSFTAAAVAQLVEQGKLSFDDPVVKYLPEFKLPGGGGDKVTIHHLLTHTSSLPPLPSLGISIKDNTPPDPPDVKKDEEAKDEEKKEVRPEPQVNTYSELINYIANHECKLFGQPGEYFSYSNDCYGLLGAIIMRVTGLTYSEYLRRHILGPLGMTRSFISMEEMREHDDVTDLYYKNEEDELKHSTRWQVAPPYLAGGWLKSCATDLIRFFQMYAQAGQYKGIRVLGENSVKTNYTYRHKYSLMDHYGHGLKVRPDYHGVTLVEHGGALKGVSSNAGFVPEKGISAVVLCNLSMVPVSKIWLAAVNLALGLPVDTPRHTYVTREFTSKEMEQFVGTYKSGEGASFDIAREDGELKIKFKKDHCVIKAIDDNTGLYVLKGQEMELRFYQDNTGKVWGVGLGVRIIPKVS